MSWTNRTPRSAIRRASRQLRAYPPSVALWPVSSNAVAASVSFDSLRQVGQLGHAALHAERHLVLGDARVDFRVAEGLLGHVVELGLGIEHGSAVVWGDAGRVRQIQYRVAA